MLTNSMCALVLEEKYKRAKKREARRNLGDRGNNRRRGGGMEKRLADMKGSALC
jgi:hypothetical protein